MSFSPLSLSLLLALALGAAVGLALAWSRGAFQRHPGGAPGVLVDSASVTLPLVAGVVAADVIPGYAGLATGAALILLVAVTPWARGVRWRLRRASGLQ